MASSGNFGGGMQGGPNAGGNAGPMGGSKSGGFFDRPDRGPTTGTITPNYNWSDWSPQDFSIGGALTNALSGILGGNMYAGRTPTGFTSSQQRDLGALGPKAQGNTGGKSYGGLLGYGQQFPGSSGRSAAGIGLQKWNAMIAAQQAAIKAAQQAKVRDQQATSVNTRPVEQIATKYQGVNANGLPEYGVWQPYHSFLR